MEYQSISRYLSRWLPEAFTERADTKPEIKIRARVLVGLFFSNAIILAVCFLVFLTIQLTSQYNFSIAIWSLIAAGVMLFFQIFMFYKLGNVGASAIVYSMSFFSVTFAVLIATGGWMSPTRQLFFCAPIVSFLVGGRHEGVYISVMTLFAGLLVLVAYRMGFQIFQVIKPENMDIVGAIIWIISINILIACLTVYDAILEDYSRLTTARR